MGRLSNMFSSTANRGALMPFITGGYPEKGMTARVIRTLVDTGVDAIEVGIPFSDPIADGPVIAESMHLALQGGANPASVFSEIESVRKDVDIPIIAMVSFSIVVKSGGTRFITRAAEAGFDGFIIPDCDIAGIDSVLEEIDRHNLAFSTLVAPDTSDERLAAIAGLAREFIYLLARKGITGESSRAPEISRSIARVNAVSDLPIAAGFGISNPEHVSAVLQSAQGAIVGSALVRVMSEAHRCGDDVCAAARRCIEPLVSAVRVGG